MSAMAGVANQSLSYYCYCERSEAIFGIVDLLLLDCFATSFLAMAGVGIPAMTDYLILPS